MVSILPLLVALLPVALAVPAPIPGSGCTAVGIITARASTESPGEGIIGSLAELIQRQSRQTVSRASVDYPAVLSPYPSSSATGVVALKRQLTAAVAACPQQKIVLLGYSQGAHVLGDVLGGGGGGALGAKTPAISSDISSHVVAFIQMGDPRHTSDESYHVGDARRNGVYPRGNDQKLGAFASIGRSYCDSGDTFCDSGFSTITHLGYTREYNDEALAFVLARIGG